MRFALFLVRRLLAIVVLALAVTAAAFTLFRVAGLRPATIAQINGQLGAGEPATVQYLHYLQMLLHGNLGQSMIIGLPVDAALRQALAPTLSLIIGAMILWLVAGILIGVTSALRPGSLMDRTVTVAALTALVLPTFLTALFLLFVFSYLARYHYFWIQPGYLPLTRNPGKWLGRMILPWIAVAATQVGVTARVTRASVLDVLGEDYIRAANARGLDSRRVLWLHILRPAMSPVIASLSIGIGTLLGSAAIVDYVFALGGIGQDLLTAVGSGDIMLVLGTTIITVILVSLVNLIIDICHALIDPRVRAF
ncbi:MAG: ABC transporter permease [Nocardiopsaceae bacterium]|jgi:peptide/nickel transport system permease protein|nr:ABC transporter permease [Nocardiopsaceae bacterium]